MNPDLGPLAALLRVAIDAQRAEGLDPHRLEKFEKWHLAANLRQEAEARHLLTNETIIRHLETIAGPNGEDDFLAGAQAALDGGEVSVRLDAAGDFEISAGGKVVKTLDTPLEVAEFFRGLANWREVRAEIDKAQAACDAEKGEA